MAVLKKRDTIAGPEAGRRPARTLLDPAALAARCRQSSLLPAPDLGPFVSAVWTLQWDFGPHEAFVQHVLPDPCVQIVVDPDGAQVMGVVTRLFSVTLTGSRFVFGFKFRPAAFHAFTRVPLSTLTNRRAPLDRFFPGVDDAVLCNLAHAGDAPALKNAIESTLRTAAPVLDPKLQQMYDVVDRIAGDSTILTVEHAAQLFGLTPRALQRLCRSYVGAAPKWLIRLYRIKEAAARIDDGDVGGWADLAARLGYADQAHFINDFRRLVGRSPGRYAGSSSHRRTQKRAVTHTFV